MPIYHERKAQSLKDAIEKRFPARIGEIKEKIANLKTRNSSEVEQEEKNLAVEQTQFEEMKAIKIVDPTQTFDKKYTITLGSDTIDLIYPGPGHTRCNSIVYFRNQKVVHTGDLLFEGSFPYIGW